MLPTQKEDDEKASVVVGRVELQLWRDLAMAGGGGNGQCALTKTQMAQRRGGRAEGDYGGAGTVAIARRGRALCCQWRRRSCGAALCLLRATKEKTENRMRAREGAGECGAC